jgi:hypothetical protein
VQQRELDTEVERLRNEVEQLMQENGVIAAFLERGGASNLDLSKSVVEFGQPRAVDFTEEEVEEVGHMRYFKHRIFLVLFFCCCFSFNYTSDFCRNSFD